MVTKYLRLQAMNGRTLTKELGGIGRTMSPMMPSMESYTMVMLLTIAVPQEGSFKSLHYDYLELGAFVGDASHMAYRWRKNTVKLWDVGLIHME